MKIILLLFIALVLIIFISCNGSGHSPSSAKYIGKWKEADGSDYAIVFDNEGYVTECSHGECIGGKIKDYEGNNGNVKYKFDNDNNPSFMELLSTNDSSKKITVRRGIVRFTEEGKMQLKLNAKPNGDKPKNFEGASHELIKDNK